MICTTLLCGQNVISDKTTNKVSIMNILDETDSSQFPFILPMSIYAALERNVGESSNPKVSIKMEMGGKELVNAPIRIDFIENNLSTKSIVTASGIMIPAPGELSVSIVNESNILKTHKIHIKDSKAILTENKVV